MAEAQAKQSRWLGFAGIAFALLVAAFGIWLTQASDRVVGFDTHRNDHDLQIVAEGLASWPATIASMAEKNFVPQRLEAPDAAAAARGWQAQARFWHPELGRFRIDYALVASGAACPDADAGGRRAWFAADALEIRDTLDADALEAADRRVLPGLGGDWRAWLGRGVLRLPAGTPRLCFAARLPLAALIHADTAMPRAFELLIADAEGHVAAQFGADPLPLADLAQLKPAASLSGAVIGALPGAPRTAAAPPRTLNPLGPTRVSSGAHDYDAYVRDIALPGPQPGGVVHAQAVALIAAGGLLDRIPQAPIILAGFAVPLLLLLALTAVLKLRLIGPGEALARTEVAALAAGLVGAVALVTAAAAFAVDVEVSRARAGVRTADTVLELRRQFAAEVAPLLGLEGSTATGWRDRRGVWQPPEDCLTVPLPLASVLGPPDPGYPLRERRRAEVDTRHASLDNPQAIAAHDTLRLPPRESAFVVGQDGQLWPGTAISACRSNNGGRLDVAPRAYFGRALEGDTAVLPTRARPRWQRLRLPGAGRELLAAPAYAIEEVRSQSDGIDKTLVAFPAIVGERVPGRSREPDAVLVSAGVLRSLLVPVLPPTERFMVVDLGDPGLEVLFHSDRQRVHFEHAARELKSPKLAAILTRLRGPKAADDGPPALTSTYDGARQHFGLARLPFTNWAILAWHSHDSADAVPAQVLLATMMSFSALVVAVWGVPALVLAALGKARWGWLWPDARMRGAYNRLGGALALTAALGVLLLLLWPAGPLWAALACWAGGLASGIVVLRGPKGAGGPLRPDTARAYRNAVVAALVTMVAVPMIAVHADAARFGRRSVDTDARIGLDAGLAARTAATAAISNVYFSDLRAARRRVLAPTDLTGVAAGCWRPLPDAERDTGLAQRLFRGLYHGPAPGASTVTPALAALACPGTSLALGSLATFAEPKIEWESGSLARVVWIVVVVGLGLGLLGAALAVILERLFGLATPLEAVTYPPLALSDDFAALVLPPKVMIVRPPLGLRNQLFDHGHRIDLSDETLTPIAGPQVTPAWAPPRHYILYNLELTLREPERRRAALRYIEKLVEKPGVRDGTTTLVLVAELTPLERLLQAYEHEKIAAQTDEGRDLEAIRRQREDIRWSKLLEDFQTFIFGSVDKLIRAPRTGETAVETAVIGELAGLPEHVIATLLPAGTPIPVSMSLRTTAAYDALYRDHVLGFARDLHAASPQAAIDFIGLMLIEHYQQLWSASSRAEQLVLHNLSMRRIPSIAARDALKSLIRRGLVAYDPVPRLFNASFAAFVQHAERPQTLQRWKADAPKGGWRFAVWPLLIILPLGLLLLGGAILDSGQPLVALLPLLVATGPALLQALGVFRKATT